MVLGRKEEGRPDYPRRDQGYIRFSFSRPKILNFYVLEHTGGTRGVRLRRNDSFSLPEGWKRRKLDVEINEPLVVTEVLFCCSAEGLSKICAGSDFWPGAFTDPYHISLPALRRPRKINC